jgi:prephenate dehydrogenase|tara:strand:+ start:184 stop:387 length:204 start_codon:yes stop_codon:yes gene_type:complete
MTDKPVPMTTEEEYRNADVDIGQVVELQQKEIRDLVKDNQLLIAEIDRLRSQIERLKNLIVNNDQSK